MTFWHGFVAWASVELVLAVSLVMTWVLHTIIVPKRLAAVMDLAKVAVEAAKSDAELLNLKTQYEMAERYLRLLAKRVGVNLDQQEAYAMIQSVYYQYAAFEAVD